MRTFVTTAGSDTHTHSQLLQLGFVGDGHTWSDGTEESGNESFHICGRGTHKKATKNGESKWGFLLLLLDLSSKGSARDRHEF